MATALRYLRWADVNPAGHPFSGASVRGLVEPLVRRVADADPSRKLPGDLDRDALEESIDRALIATYGAWTAGWRWAASEPGGGGPVRTWCCPRDSLFRPDDPELLASVDRVAGAVDEWRRFLVELGGVFARLHAATDALALAPAVEHAAAHLLPLVLERTSAEDAWYSTFQIILGWYLESAGFDPALIAPAIEDVVSGRFESWVTPDDATQRAACAELGERVTEAEEDGTLTHDATAAWHVARERAFPPHAGGPRPRTPDPMRRDGHLAWIDGPERARDPGRADRMRAALDACRASARLGDALTFDRLASWQALVLGVPRAGFRTGTAYAKAGRELYPLGPKTQPRFEAALAETDDATPSPAARAARAYLDVCFYHPFDDGNARAARLAMDHVLTRHGLALHAVEPLFCVARAAADASGHGYFAHLVTYLAGPVSKNATP